MRIAYVAPYQGPGSAAAAGPASRTWRSPAILRSSWSPTCCISMDTTSRSSHREKWSRTRYDYFPPFTEAPENWARRARSLCLCASRSLSQWLVVDAGYTEVYSPKRHRTAPFDLVLIYNLDQPQVECARSGGADDSGCQSLSNTRTMHSSISPVSAHSGFAYTAPATEGTRCARCCSGLHRRVSVLAFPIQNTAAQHFAPRCGEHPGDGGRPSAFSAPKPRRILGHAVPQ